MRLLLVALLATAASAQDGARAPADASAAFRVSRCDAGVPMPNVLSHGTPALAMPEVEPATPTPVPILNLCGEAPSLSAAADPLTRFLQTPTPHRFRDIPHDGRRWLRDIDPYTLDDRLLAYPDFLDHPSRMRPEDLVPDVSLQRLLPPVALPVERP